MNINLGSIQMPINAATKTFALLAKRGAGKSYTGAVMAEMERAFEGNRTVVCDRELPQTTIYSQYESSVRGGKYR